MAGAQSRPLRIGTAGWTIPRGHADRFPEQGSHLERYAHAFNAVEIESSFKTPHRGATYRRWAESVPADFRFSVKVPREITHVRRLADAEEPLSAFLDAAQGVGEKLGALLLQLPPSLAFDPEIAARFFAALAGRFRGTTVVEPRHASWFTDAGERFLEAQRAPRVAADPPPVAGADSPGGWRGLVYYRLHGTPVMYRSAYEREFLTGLARRLRGAALDAECWVVFDNTAEGQAVPDAFALLEALGAD
jgi:uncharacterized protein YecE (DUF72 family)